jgi:hypothetical protein
MTIVIKVLALRASLPSACAGFLFSECGVAWAQTAAVFRETYPVGPTPDNARGLPVGRDKKQS